VAQTNARPADTDDEPLTTELLEKLLASRSPEAYLSGVKMSDSTLPDYLARLLDEHGLTRSQVIRASGLNATFCYQVFQGTRHPGRDNAIMLSFGLGCTLRETQRLLRHAGVSELWCKKRRDAIIIFCVEHGMTRERCDDKLYELGEKTLLAAGE
jgi:hypothetical protein